MKKIILLLCFLSCTACLQTSAYLGPSLTLATSGNIYQTSFSAASNYAIKKSTGKTPTEHAMIYIKEKKAKDQEDKIIKKNKEKLTGLLHEHILMVRTKHFK